MDRRRKERTMGRTWNGMALAVGASLALGTWSMAAWPAAAQRVVQSRGVDARVDYPSLTRFGPWDDRNYQLRAEDIALMAPNEAEQTEGIPAFYRVKLRKAFPEMRREGPAQYPRSAMPRYRIEYGGYLVDGRVYRKVERRGDRWWIDLTVAAPSEAEMKAQRTSLAGEVRVTDPHDAAESAIAISPADPEKVVAGSNGPVNGQDMHYSTDGGVTWSMSTLPMGDTCCDPTVGWSSDGTKAYAATLGLSFFNVYFYRSADGGVTWTDLATEPGNDPRREIGTSTDKEYLHVDRFAASPFRDNLYLTWHESNVMMVARSTNFGHTWQDPLVIASQEDELGIGSDMVTDKAGNVYYFWPAFNSQKIWVRKSTNGGTTYQPRVQVAATQGSFIFPIPSMETRAVFIYNSADADLGNGPFANSLYVAWTDTTAPASLDPASNHARIQVAYSRDGGASWNVSTPHEVADASNVDRWHQWLTVGPDGKVYVIFYDTRRDPSRTSVDLFYAVSSDGAVTWTTPARLTGAQSPNIGDGFEFGDYNGLDVIANRLIAVFTDNRPEGGGGPSVDVYAAGRLTDVLFGDGFETGDTAAWSAVVPP
jgi:hypothetical protein